MLTGYQRNKPRNTHTRFYAPGSKVRSSVNYYKQCITLGSLEKITPCSSWKLAFPSMAWCLLSSQVPSPFLETVLKLVEVHQPFLKHAFSHDNKLGEANRSAAWPFSRLFPRAVKYAEREFVKSFSAADITAYMSLQQNNQEYLFDVHYLTELCIKCRVCM